ncbi:MAG: ferredoxin family protein [Sedimentisphaerales bacterium]|nr:ferredoxin family protein [Sedimentisphaerales bacterium]
MTGKIVIDTERCKGCGLCVIVCPRGSIIISDKSNKNGYFPAQYNNNNECTGCAACAIMCPEAIIEVFRNDSGEIETIDEPKKISKPSLIKEKA